MASRQWIKIRSVALPSEHGGWGFLIEPVLLGLLLAPTWPGAALAVAALAAFLAHQPLKVTLKDWRKGRSGQRTRYAQRFALGYGLVALVAFGWAALQISLLDLLPLAVALPFALIQTIYDAQNKSREAVAELSGALALGSIAPTLALIGGWGVNAAFTLWALLAVRSVTSILYIRSRLRLERGDPHTPGLPWAAHVGGIGVVSALAAAALAPWLALVGVVMLTVRALWGLSAYRRRMRVALIGVQELALGLGYVGLIAAGYMLG
jgi:hypothetical protein